MITSLLKPLFVSKARIKILHLFFSYPEQAFFVREITRKTDEQINAVRRELENLEEASLVSSYAKAGKKYYVLNPDYFFYSELESMFQKVSLPALQVVEKCEEMGENIDLLILTGRFVGLPENAVPIDMFIVGDVLNAQISEFIQEKMDEEMEVRFAVVSKEEFLERLQRKDKILKNLLTIPQNITPINTMRKLMPK